MGQKLPEHIDTALRDYALRRDRATPPVFVGRDDELRFLRETVHAARSGAEGLTTVVQGVPGAGKSALCSHFETELRSALATEAPTVVIPKGADFFDKPPLELVKELAAHVPTKLSGLRQLRQLPGFENLDSFIRGTVGTATALLRRGASFDLMAQAWNLNESSSFDAAMETFAEKLWAEGATLVLTIDELQSINDTALARRNLMAVHEKRFGVAIVVLGFGLQNTTRKLRQMGLSRLAQKQVRTLGSMKREESEDLVLRSFKHLGLTTDDEDWLAYIGKQGFGRDEWTNWRNAVKAAILEDSADFPHHLVNSIAGLCETLLEHGLRPPGTRELDAIRASCRDCKRDYYGARLEPFADHTLALAAALRQGRGENVPAYILLDALATSANNGSAVDRSAASSIMGELIERGLFKRTANATMAPSLPSLASYLDAELDGALAAGNEVARRLADALDLEPDASSRPADASSE